MPSGTPVPVSTSSETVRPARAVPGLRRRTVLVDRPAPVDPQIATRLRRWVRDVLDLDDDTTVLVSQIACRDAGCAPVETVLAVLRPGAPTSRRLPARADRLCAADVLAAFRATGARSSA